MPATVDIDTALLESPQPPECGAADAPEPPETPLTLKFDVVQRHFRTNKHLVMALDGIGTVTGLLSPDGHFADDAFLFMVPSVILSGFATPMSYFLIIVRKVFLEGADFSSLTARYWPIAVIGLVILVAAAWLFRKRLS